MSTDQVAPPDDAASEEDSGRPLQHDSRRPPRWFTRGLVMAAITVFVAAFAWHAFFQLKGLIVNILIAFFIALALEPIVLWLVRHGWKRGLAAGAALLGTILFALAIVALFGNLFVQQLLALFRNVPAMYADLQDWLARTFDVSIPDSADLVKEAMGRWGDDVASGVLLVGTSVVSALFAITTILLVVYYLSAAGPRFRAAVCARLTPNRQAEVLMLWETAQRKASDFITSRVVLAALSSVFTFVFLTILRTPYALPLALFTGIVSQFVPTIGTYIGGALPVIVALTSQGIPQAIAVLAFIVAYQQIENYIFSPKVSAKALEMNPAVAFLVVLAFGAVFGAIGAFLALPVAATIQAVMDTYWKRHELVESEMLRDPERVPPRDRWQRVRRRGDEDETGTATPADPSDAPQDDA
ncbi:AI-2E family transporter [Luteimicrobium sp. NPDC057192]|uniref:AI-2E family transporter n=1 Tax=Luteimicrobium sp. NPDC057192 TaxID=3346042 RepID=UPI003626EEC3